METLTAQSNTHFNKQVLVGIYEQHSPGLYRYAYRLLGSQDHAEECVAETFSRFLHSVQAGSRPDNVQAYLYRVAHNWIIDQYRRQPVLESLEENDLPAGEASPGQAAAENLERERVRAALRLLPPEQQQVVALRFLEERSHEEVAAILGKTPEATRALQYRAIAALKRILIETEHE